MDKKESDHNFLLKCLSLHENNIRPNRGESKQS